MSLGVGTRLGPYEILSALGAGGMGEVYRARDTRLKRDVALKILPESFAADPDRLARFQREAEVLASLNHPNIATIHGFEASGDTHALVLELVEGETLADRLKAGPLPVSEALPIARQVADALQAAHERGIVHRDLKPANIAMTVDGQVKVLDFGLAKLARQDNGVGPVNVTASPTITSPVMMTSVGVLLGTAAYMSPEQAKGREADKRSDVWAFGCVLYEMLTGRRPFEGEDLSDTLANVLKTEPDWTALPADLPLPVRMLVQRCLVKDRRQRLADISIALFLLAESTTLGAVHVTPDPALNVPPRQRAARYAGAAFGGAALVAAAGIALWLTMRAAPLKLSRLQILPPAAQALSLSSGATGDLALNPDGTQIIYASINNTLIVRPLDQLDGTTLTGLGSAAPHGLFVSPNGQWIGFVTLGNATLLKKVAITGGPPQSLGRLDGGLSGATWGPEDEIVFGTTNADTGLQRLAPGAQEAAVLTRPDPAAGEADHVFPEFLPGGKAILFTIRSITGDLDQARIAVFDLQSMKSKTLLSGGVNAHYLPSGHLLYGAAGGLRAVPFDLAKLAVSGTSVPVAPVVVTKNTGAVDVAVARDGTFVYVPGVAAETPQTLVWVDRHGHAEPFAPIPQAYANPRLSPDGTRLALEIHDQQSDIWTWDLAQKEPTRLTSNPMLDRSPVWTRDGGRVVFSSGRSGVVPPQIFSQSVVGAGKMEAITHDAGDAGYPRAISPEGTLVIEKDGDLMTLTTDQDPPRSDRLTQTPAVERNADISSDGGALAFESNASGSYEIRVRPFPAVNEGGLTVSAGTRPLWAKSGSELFYVAPSGALMSVPIERGPQWKVGTPVKLFDWPIPTLATRSYDVTKDGQRFLMLKPAPTAEATAPSTLVVVQNWLEELKRSAPAK